MSISIILHGFKFLSGVCPQYMNEIIKLSSQNNTVARNSSSKLFEPLKTKPLTHKCLSYLGPRICNGLPDDINLLNNGNTFKHKVKKSLLTLRASWDQVIYVYYG